MRTVLPYTFFSLLWIWGSDEALIVLTRDPELLSRISMYKGWAFVVVTSLLLFFLILRRLHSHQALHERLEARRVELDEFLYAASHQMRKPLVTIEGFASEISDTLMHNETPDYLELRTASTQIRNGAKELDGILRSLTRLHRSLRDNPHPIFIPCERAVERMVTSLRHQYPSIECSLSVSHLPPIYADHNQMEILLHEILENCFRHHHPNLPLAIEVSGTARKNRSVLFIQDNGPGFNLGTNNDLFQPILRKQETHDSNTLRLGLALAWRCAHWNGGTLAVQSTKGQGTKVTVELPGK